MLMVVVVTLNRFTDTTNIDDQLMGIITHHNGGTADLVWRGVMVQGVLIALIAICFLFSYAGLRSGSSFIYNRYMDSVEKFKDLEGLAEQVKRE